MKKEILDILEGIRRNKYRARIWYGDKNGNSWDEEHDVTGYISKSTGIKPCLLLVNNTRSMGGGAILTNCIIRIDLTSGKTLYQHENINLGTWEQRGEKVYKDGNEQSTHKTEQAAKRYIEFMTGKRYCK